MTIESDIIAVHEARGGQCEMLALWADLPQHKQASVASTVSAMVKAGKLKRTARARTAIAAHADTPPTPTETPLRNLPPFERAIAYIERHGPTPRPKLLSATNITQPVITELVAQRKLHYTGGPNTEVGKGPHPKHDPGKHPQGRRNWGSGHPIIEANTTSASEESPPAEAVQEKTETIPVAEEAAASPAESGTVVDEAAPDTAGGPDDPPWGVDADRLVETFDPVPHAEAAPTTTLAPCPFCGSVNVRVAEPYLYVACGDCQAHGPIPKASEFDALVTMRWNTRA